MIESRHRIIQARGHAILVRVLVPASKQTAARLTTTALDLARSKSQIVRLPVPAGAASENAKDAGGEMVVLRANGPDRRRAMLRLAQLFADDAR